MAAEGRKMPELAVVVLLGCRKAAFVIQLWCNKPCATHRSHLYVELVYVQ